MRLKCITKLSSVTVNHSAADGSKYLYLSLCHEYHCYKLEFDSESNPDKCTFGVIPVGMYTSLLIFWGLFSLFDRSKQTWLTKFVA